MWTAAPTADGALGPPQQISDDLGLQTGKFVLAKDGQTLYGADVQSTINSANATYATGNLKAFRVTSTSVDPLAAPHSIPFHGRLAAGADDITSSPDGRFIYLSTETTGATNAIFRSAPGIRVFATRP